MKKILLSLVILLFLVQACAAPTSAPTEQAAPTEPAPTATEPVPEARQGSGRGYTASRLEKLGGYPCPTVTSPVSTSPCRSNHFDPQDNTHDDGRLCRPAGRPVNARACSSPSSADPGGSRPAERRQLHLSISTRASPKVSMWYSSTSAASTSPVGCSA